MNEPGDPDKAEQGQNKVFFHGGFYWIAAGAVVLSGVVFWLSRVFGQQTEQYSFIAQAVVNVLIFAAILVQALIYRRQWDAMRSGLVQNIRAIKATEKSAKVAEDAFHVGEAPYFGIAKIAPEDFDGGGYSPHVKITFMNGGKTPAWHFHSEAKFILGKTIQEGEVFDLKTNWHDLENTFSPSGQSRTFEYVNSALRHTAELQNDLESGRTYIFMLVIVHYQDFRKVWHGRDFWLLWDETFKNFRDLDATRQNCTKCKKNDELKK